MKLRLKTLLALGLTFGGLIIVLYVVSHLFLIRSFIELENEDSRRNLERVTRALDNELSFLDSSTLDWAMWDDTYNFMADLSQQYIDTNITDSTFTTLKLNLLLYLDTSGKVVLGKGFDLYRQKETPIPPDIIEELSSSDCLWGHAGTRSKVCGILSLPEGPMLVVSRPVITSAGEGPIRGALVMGRFLDATGLQHLAETSWVSVSIQSFVESNLPSDFKSVKSLLSTGTTAVTRVLDSRTVAGYTLLNDVYGKPAFILRVDMPRSIYQRGLTSLRYFFAELLICGAISALAAMIAIERGVIARLIGLGNGLKAIGMSGDLSTRVEVNGGDEVADLASTINETLEALEASRLSERQAEDKTRAHIRRLEALYEVSQVLVDSPDPQSLARQALEKTLKAMVVSAGVIWYVDDTGGLLLLAHNGLPAGAIRELRKIPKIMSGEGLVGRALASGKLTASEDLTGEDDGWLKVLVNSGFQSAILLPLASKGSVVGVISGFSRQARILNVEDLEMLTSLGNILGMSIINARLGGLSNHSVPPSNR
ncbi:MAG: CHASE4 domain-containing protein [Chloroflexota bacterium]